VVWLVPGAGGEVIGGTGPVPFGVDCTLIGGTGFVPPTGGAVIRGTTVLELGPVDGSAPVEGVAPVESSAPEDGVGPVDCAATTEIPPVNAAAAQAAIRRRDIWP
jgi:hypothetical protein